MTVKITIFLVFALPVCTLSRPEKRDCSNCVGYRTCEAAVEAIGLNDPDVDEQLRSVFCGFDSHGLPMVCCSELTTKLTATQIRLTDVEKHPNVGLLPENCGGKCDGRHVLIVGGGYPADLYEYPWMALLSYKTRLGPQFKCGGSLIHDRYILTAAHCISGQELYGVRIGELDIETIDDCSYYTGNCESKLQDIHIEEAIPHPEYQGLPALRNDIGLIRLRKPVDLSFKNADTICLPITSELRNRNITGQSATVAGWGFTEKGYASSRLLAVDVPIHHADYCRKLYNRGIKGEVDEMTNKICSGADGKDACRGDSGGPLMLKLKTDNFRCFQYGIVSYGPRTCGSDFPGIYTDVTKYMKWILDTIRP